VTLAALVFVMVVVVNAVHAHEEDERWNNLR
jgi:hypothetical protein